MILTLKLGEIHVATLATARDTIVHGDIHPAFEDRISEFLKCGFEYPEGSPLAEFNVSQAASAEKRLECLAGLLGKIHGITADWLLP